MHSGVALSGLNFKSTAKRILGGVTIAMPIANKDLQRDWSLVAADGVHTMICKLWHDAFERSHSKYMVGGLTPASLRHMTHPLTHPVVDELGNPTGEDRHITQSEALDACVEHAMRDRGESKSARIERYRAAVLAYDNTHGKS